MRTSHLFLRATVLGMAGLALGLAPLASAQDMGIGQVTLMAGTPMMVGESIRPLQMIFTGRQLETGEEDAAGLLVEDVVVHVGRSSSVNIDEQPGVKRITVERGFVVVYTEPSTVTNVVVSTPFGRMDINGAMGADGQSGWFSVRHDPEQAGVSAAVSTFASMEGTVEVVGTTPGVGPYRLDGGQQWRIVDGEPVQGPIAGDEREAAEDLRRFLHRESIDLVGGPSVELTELAMTDILIPDGAEMTTSVVDHPEQFVIDNNAAVQFRDPSFNLADTSAPVLLPVNVNEFVFAPPTYLPSGDPNVAAAQYVSYEGVPVDPNWNNFLTAANGNPAFQPTYLTSFANGGFSYLQFAGSDAQLVLNNGVPFFATDQQAATGWALFTPQTAVADAGFDAGNGAAAVVTAGFEAVAMGEYLGGGGTIGGAGNADAAYGTLVDGTIQPNPSLPAGYPQLDQADVTTGLASGGDLASDQLAALGAGLNPLNLSLPGAQLLFISDSQLDALGNGFNFDGDTIAATDLNLPGNRQPSLDNTGAASVATPLQNNADNTVGIQFASRGDVIAIIHHAGSRNVNAASLPASGNFEVVRGDGYSVVRWQSDGHVAGSDGEPLEFEDLNANAGLRNELFGLISEEVNNLVPEGSHTVAGPAYAEVGDELRQLRRVPGSLVRTGRTINTRRADIHRVVGVGRGIPARVRALDLSPGRLTRTVNTGMSRRHIGRATTTR